MTPDEDPHARVRSAYERARVLKGLRTASIVLPMSLVSFGRCGEPSASLAIASLLVVLVTVLVWRGGSVARAVVPGYVAGTVPLAIPLLVSPACDSMGVGGSLPFLACVAGGLVSGAIVVHFAARERVHRAAFVVAGGAVAALAGSLGCVVIGLGGVVAMAVGLVLVAPFALRGAPAR